MANTFLFDDDEEQPTADDTFADNDDAEEGGESSNNRTFMIAAIALGGIVLLSLICMGVYAMVILPGQKQAQLSADATMVAVNTQSAIAVAQTQEVMAYTPTLAPTDTPLPTDTPTPVLVSATDTPAPAVQVDPATATVEAQMTILAGIQLTSQAQGTPAAAFAAAGTPGIIVETPMTGTPKPVSELSKTGFADEVGLPAITMMAVVLVALILVVRRLRTAPTR